MNANYSEPSKGEIEKEKIRERYKGVNPDELDFIPATAQVGFYEDDSEKNVAIYARVSTDGISQTSSYELQKNHYTDVISRHTGWNLYRMYADEGISGTSLAHRDEFVRMIEDCKAGKVDLIVTKSVSRFARNILDCIGHVRELAALPKSVQQFLNTVQFKLPGLSFLLSPKVDQWGRTTNKDNVVLRSFENFISPGYISTRNETKADKEIAKIYESTGESSVLPSYAAKYFTSKGETTNFTSSEYADFSKKRGQLSFDTINSILSDPDYQKLSAEDKAELIKDIYGLSNAIAKSEVSDKYTLAANM